MKKTIIKSIEWLGKRLFNVTVAVDQLGNTLAIWRSDPPNPDETISSYWGRTTHVRTISSLGCRMLHLLDKNHCYDAIEWNLLTSGQRLEAQKSIDWMRSHGYAP